jgi:hypothetical protein
MNYTSFGADATLTKADLDWFLFLCQSLNKDLSTALMAGPMNFLEPYAQVIEQKVSAYNFASQKLSELIPSNQSLINQNASIITAINSASQYLAAQVKGLQSGNMKALIVPQGGKVGVPTSPSTVYAFSPMQPAPAGSALFASTLTSVPIVARGVDTSGTFNVAYSTAQKIKYNIPETTAPVSPTTGTVAPTPMPNNAPSSAGVVGSSVKSTATLPLIIAGGTIAALLLLK